MAVTCTCQERHERRRIVLTGGPGAGKTAVLELLRQSLCEHVAIVPESAGIIFGGGFPRNHHVGVRRAAQLAISCVQQQLEAAADSQGERVLLCDRGVIDGIAYWPGPDDFFAAVGATRSELLARYYAVIHLRVPHSSAGYGQQNPLRVETADQARAIDERILEAWSGHPRRHLVEVTPDFITKATRALEVIASELPECCRDHVKRALRLPDANS